MSFLDSRRRLLYIPYTALCVTSEYRDTPNKVQQYLCEYVGLLEAFGLPDTRLFHSTIVCATATEPQDHTCDDTLTISRSLVHAVSLTNPLSENEKYLCVSHNDTVGIGCPDGSDQILELSNNFLSPPSSETTHIFAALTQALTLNPQFIQR